MLPHETRRVVLFRIESATHVYPSTRLLESHPGTFLPRLSSSVHVESPAHVAPALAQLAGLLWAYNQFSKAENYVSAGEKGLSASSF